MLQDWGGLGHDKLMVARNQLLGMAAQDPRLAMVRPNGLEDVPEYRLDVDGLDPSFHMLPVRLLLGQYVLRATW